MEQPKIQPDKITKPIQLLAVWFAGLVILVGVLLAAAKTINNPIWLTPVLAISAISIIPMFLYFIFLLQTKYRPQMQEDTFYSKFLDTSTNKQIILKDKPVKNTASVDISEQVIYLTEANKNLLNKIEEFIKNSTVSNFNTSEIEKYIQASKENFSKVEEKIKRTQFDIKLNTLLPEWTEYRLLLIKNSFENIEEFTGGGGKLDKLLLTVGHNVEPKFVAQILGIPFPKRLEYINLINPRMYESEMYSNSVVIGSHAYDISDRITLKIDSILIETLANMDSKESFHNIFK